MSTSSLEKDCNPDIQKERRTRTFNHDELATILAGGVAERMARKEIHKMIEDDKNFDGPDPAFMSRMEKLEEWMRKSALVVRKKDGMLKNASHFMYLDEIVSKNRPSAFTELHQKVFIPTLQGQATEEQKKKWLTPALKYEILGAYAQTEMGHGTFLRGLETTAHYDPITEEFVLNSPTTSSIKWWPGALAKVSTHAAVMAQLYTKGKCHGVHMFIVQLRSMEDHKSLPGITLGDIGPKFGANELDNGFLRLDHVRIPRENMLMKHAQVLPDGTYVKPKKPELTYATMTMLRCNFLKGSTTALGIACTIAIRYSAVRRQSEMRPGEPEPQVLDYPTQQHKLFTLLSTTYAFFFLQKRMLEMYNKVNEAVSHGDISDIKELHALSSGLKAFVTAVANDGMEVCRMSCGGHGYSQASGFPNLYSNCTALCTAEGENTVMLLQAARYLMKCMHKDQLVEKSVSYLKQRTVHIKQPISLTDLNTLCKLYEQRARGLVRYGAYKVDEVMKTGEDLIGALNRASLHTVRAVVAHCHYYVVKTFIDEVTTLKVSDSLRTVLLDLARLYALDGIAKNSGEFMEENLMSGDEVKKCHQHVADILPKIRPNAVALVDAFEFPDGYLMSVLGRYDGNVYENLLKWAMNSELNKSDVIPAYEKYIRPLLKRNQSKL